MILVDVNQVVISNIVQYLSIHKETNTNENMIRHMVLNCIRSYSRQFKAKYGDIVICCDSLSYWRKEYFPYYKYSRKRTREKSKLDWNVIFDGIKNTKQELKDYFPYKVIEVEGAEADDVIAVLVKKLSPIEDILILSADKDFAQLQKYKNVHQYSPMLKRFIHVDDPESFLKEHILYGDKDDGIPNFLSPDDIFVHGERQKVITKKNLNVWIHSDPKTFCVNDDMIRGYTRNKTLVDLECVPENIQEKILQEYEAAKPHTKKEMLDYLYSKKLVALIESAEDF